MSSLGNGLMVGDEQSVVYLNVGGQKFTTQLGTLRTHRTSALFMLFSPPYPLHQDPKDGSFFIDRNGEVFGLILDYLRTGTLVVPRDPTLYAVLRREVMFYGLPIALQLPPSQPLSWEAAPMRYKHVRIILDEVEKSIEWEEGALPDDLHTRQLFEIVEFFAGRGYQMVSEYTSRGTRGFSSIWMVKRETYPGADIGVEVTSKDPAYVRSEPSSKSGQKSKSAVSQPPLPAMRPTTSNVTQVSAAPWASRTPMMPTASYAPANDASYNTAQGY